jgi:bacillolysin
MRLDLCDHGASKIVLGRKVMRTTGFVGVVGVLSFLSAAVVQGQAHNGGGWLGSLTEPREGLVIRDVSRQTGHATFASTPGNGVLLDGPPGASAAERALVFIDHYGRQFGLADRSQVRHTKTRSDDLGLEHVRMQQVHHGIPVTAAEFLVHLKGARVMAANGRTISDLPENVLPSVPAELAKNVARRLIAKRRLDEGETATYSEPRLEILNRAFVASSGSDRSRLAWFVEARGVALRQYIWIDAQNGAILFTFSQLTDAKNRRVHSAGNTPSLPGTLVRSEGGAATGDSDNDKAYDFAGITFDYFFTQHGRDSFDDAGAQIVSTTHYCPADVCPGDFANAFWNGTQMVYGNGYASADDVVGHELTHAVTEHAAGLYYYQQSGALNESFSDIFGETIDLSFSAPGGNDTAAARWYLGEDLGAIRNMGNPNEFEDPAAMSDSTYFKCSTSSWTDPNADHGGVHSNSGIPNLAYALMVDGGIFNGKNVSGIGLTKAAKIEYRALQTYLFAGSNFIDDYNAINQSCTDLIGTSGISAGDCTQVTNALEAVEMHLPWGCAGATQAPPRCPSGQPSFVFNDGFENGIGNWTPSNTQVGFWSFDNTFAKTGVGEAYGNAPEGISIHTLTMINPVIVPANGRMYFDHLFEFENDIFDTYDGGRFEYSTNGGASWNDANALVDAGHAYDGTLPATNPLGVVNAFVGGSYGYVGTRLNLGGLAGSSIKFRFAIGTDQFIASLGWLLDNVSIYSCVTPQAFTDDPLVPGVTVVKAVHVSELRNRINAVRAARGLPAATWTNALTGGAAVKSTDVDELRAALIAAYLAPPALPAPVFTDVLSLGMPVRALHITQLRSAVLGIE